ncbi:uncharacterized protein EV422DRAFT_145990 [Fimicolochytrium jonesii]|uniref:uncharacterized protein n=1 Tax=Fimicolochytrium jonesii TaxID=1396493 RepID=UPI0022FE764A|nr:uncharacterized protein EV422DRAFT_145990 [Fimicolochytrium jonesii]KAI8825913.1 hypothetical protein EV422DRAFT_145990 [Fimicolochytrium jonesii]
MNNLCFKCMHRGHINSDCPNGRDYSICEYCDSDKHHPYQCPWQWRHYVFAPYKGDQVPKELAVYCYNCGQEGHFGDDCRQRLITGNKGISAFALAALVQAFPQHRKGSKYCPPRRQSPETGRIDHDRRRSPPHHRQPVHKRFADSPISDSRSRSRSRSRSPRGSRRRSYSRSRSRSRSRDRYNNNKRHALPPRPRGRYPSRSPSPPPLRARRKSRSPPVAHRYDRGFRPYSPPPLPTYRSSRDERERGERERGGRRREDYRRESPPPQVRESKRNGYRNAPPPSPPPPPARRVNLKYQPSYKGGY